MSDKHIDDPSMDDAYLEMLGPQLAQIAATGYRQQGRGAVLIDLVSPAPAGQALMAYVPKRYILSRLPKYKQDEMKAWLHDLERYDPKQHVLVVIQRPDMLYPHKLSAIDEASETLELGPAPDISDTIALCIKLLEETNQEQRHIDVMKALQGALSRTLQAALGSNTTPSA